MLFLCCLTGYYPLLYICSFNLGQHSFHHSFFFSCVKAYQLKNKDGNAINKDCKFQTFFYSLVSPSEINLITALPGCDPALWKSAQEYNPDPTKFAPALAVGFQDLNNRMKRYEKSSELFSRRIEEVRKQINTMEHKHNQTKNRIDDLRKRQVDLSHKFLQTMSKWESQKARGIPLQTEEIDYSKKLEFLNRQLDDPARFEVRIAELQQKASTQERQSTGSAAVGLQGLDERQNEVLCQVFDFQTKSLAHLTGMLKQDLHNLKVWLGGGEGVRKNELSLSIVG